MMRRAFPAVASWGGEAKQEGGVRSERMLRRRRGKVEQHRRRRRRNKVEEEEEEEKREGGGGRWKREEEREECGPAPCRLSLNTLRRPLLPSLPSLFLFTHTHTQNARLAHKGAIAIKPSQHGAQIERETKRGREDSSPHEHYPRKTEMGGKRGREGGREGGLQRGQR